MSEGEATPQPTDLSYETYLRQKRKQTTLPTLEDRIAARIQARSANAKSISRDDISEAEPLGGENQVLSRPQIRYCLAEAIRIEGARKAMDRANPSQIEKFNTMVDDYYYRCGSFRREGSTYQRLQAEIETRRTEIEQSGAARFR